MSLTIYKSRFHRLLTAFIGEAHMLEIQAVLQPSAHGSSSSLADQLMLLSPSMFENFHNGRVSLKKASRRPKKDSVRTRATSMSLY